MLVTDSVFLLPFPYSYMMILAVVCFFEKTEQYLCVKRLTELDRNELIQKKIKLFWEKLNRTIFQKTVLFESNHIIRFGLIF